MQHVALNFFAYIVVAQSMLGSYSWSSCSSASHTCFCNVFFFSFNLNLFFVHIMARWAFSKASWASPILLLSMSRCSLRALPISTIVHMDFQYLTKINDTILKCLKSFEYLYNIMIIPIIYVLSLSILIRNHQLVNEKYVWNAHSYLRTHKV
jgi:hypothetical protein